MQAGSQARERQSRAGQAKIFASFTVFDIYLLYL